MTKPLTGEDHAWELLGEASPLDVSRRSGALYEADSGRYLLRSFGRDFSITPREHEIRALTPEGGIFLTRLAYFFRLSALWYLVKATDAMPAGRLIKPASMTGGDIFFKGSHILPLDAVAKRFGRDREGFLSTGATFGGKVVDYGDAAVELHAFPKIPATVILWLEDEEWPPRADLVLDSSACLHLPIDILWSVAMMAVLLFLERPTGG